MHIFNTTHDPAVLKKRIKQGHFGEQLRYFSKLEREIRAIIPQTIQDSAFEWETGTCLELSSPLAVMAASLSEERDNPDWPGRNRAFFLHRSDLLAYSAALAALGLFPADQTARILDDAMGNAANRTPGLERHGASTEETLALVWNSAVESARSKRRWREFFAHPSSRRWAAPAWADSPETWKTVVVLRHRHPATELCRDLPARNRESTAGLIAVLAAQKTESGRLAEEWREAGWNVASFDLSERMPLFKALNAPACESPQAAILSVDGNRPLTTLSTRLHKRGELLGDLSDEQFNAIVEAAL